MRVDRRRGRARDRAQDLDHLRRVDRHVLHVDDDEVEADGAEGLGRRRRGAHQPGADLRLAGCDRVLEGVASAGSFVILRQLDNGTGCSASRARPGGARGRRSACAEVEADPAVRRGAQQRAGPQLSSVNRTARRGVSICRNGVAGRRARPPAHHGTDHAEDTGPGARPRRRSRTKRSAADRERRRSRCSSSSYAIVGMPEVGHGAVRGSAIRTDVDAEPPSASGDLVDRRGLREAGVERHAEQALRRGDRRVGVGRWATWPNAGWRSIVGRYQRRVPMPRSRHASSTRSRTAASGKRNAQTLRTVSARRRLLHEPPVARGLHRAHRAREQRVALGGGRRPAVEARERDRGVVLGQLRVGAGGDRAADRAVVRPVEVDAEVRQAPDRVREVRVAGDDEAAFARGERLGRVQAEHRAGRAGIALVAEARGGVDDHRHMRVARERRPAFAVLLGAERRHRHDGARADLAHRRARDLGREQPRVRVDVGDDRRRGRRNAPRRRSR